MLLAGAKVGASLSVSCVSCGLLAIGGPVRVPLTVGAIESQGQHVLGIGGTPPSTGAFQALLHDIAMCALNLVRANGKILCERILVVELVSPMLQIAEALGHSPEPVRPSRRAQRVTLCLALSSPPVPAFRRRFAPRRGHTGIDGVQDHLRRAGRRRGPWITRPTNPRTWLPTARLIALAGSLGFPASSIPSPIGDCPIFVSTPSRPVDAGLAGRSETSYPAILWTTRAASSATERELTPREVDGGRAASIDPARLPGSASRQATRREERLRHPSRRPAGAADGADGGSSDRHRSRGAGTTRQRLAAEEERSARNRPTGHFWRCP